jgi:hypothetical protein
MRIKFIILLLLGLSFAEDCFDEVQISVFDQRGRPIEGADASLTCAYESFNISSASLYEKWYSRELEPSNSFGLAKLLNRKMHCICGGTVTAKASFRGIDESVNGTWHGGINAYSISLGDFYDLNIFVNDSNTGALEGAEVVVTPFSNVGMPLLHATTDDAGSASFYQIPGGSNLMVNTEHEGRSELVEVTIEESDELLNIILENNTIESTPVYENASVEKQENQSKAVSDNKSADVLDADVLPTVAPSEDASGNPSLKWFHFLMNRTDSLILEQKQDQPKFRIVFVPIGYSQNESKEFRDIAFESLDRFKEVSPFRECNPPFGEIEVFLMEPDKCNITSCSDICGTGNNINENCQTLIRNCSESAHNPYRDRINITAGLCKNASCGGSCGGCSAGIPSKSVVVNSAPCGGATVERITTHELGHALGLFHVSGPLGVNGCWDNEFGACQGPNAADCAIPISNRSRFIMAYCPSMEEYGPSAYSFLKEHALKDYLEVCK